MKLKKISLKSVSDILSGNEMKSVFGGYGESGECLKCQGYGGCAFYYIPSGTDCWSYGDAGCVYGFACGPCHLLSGC